MGLKKRSKVSAEFSMSSLTDIIFLLLIFFMLTSSLVAPNSLNLKMPGNSTSPPSKDEKELTEVSINSKGRYLVNRKEVSSSKLRSVMRGLRGQSVIISPSSRAPIEKVATVMDYALQFNINGILAAEVD